MTSKTLSRHDVELRVAAARTAVGNRRVANGDQVNRLASLAMKRKPSVDFSGYWQRRKAA